MIDTSVAWPVVVILVVPLLVIGMAELDERLRQRDSPMRGAVSIVRTWAVPAFAIWAVLRPVLGRDADSFGTQLAATVLVVALGAAALHILRVIVAGISTRPRRDGSGPPCTSSITWTAKPYFSPRATIVLRSPELPRPKRTSRPITTTAAWRPSTR